MQSKLNFLKNYPFLKEASNYVKDLDFSLNELLTDMAFEQVRILGKERVIKAIKGIDIQEDYGRPEIEILSYPTARIIVSCIKDNYLIQRYAHSESESSYHKMKNESLDNLLLIAKDFGINPQITPNTPIIHLHFTDYIRLARNIKEKKWKLVNRKLENGYVEVTKQEFARLLQEAIRERIQSKLPLEIPKDMSFVLREYIAEVKQVLNKKEKEKIKIASKSDASLKTDNFPPCIKNILDNLTKGVNLAHSARFALTSFLLNIGMEVDKIINLFNTSPDFKEDKTRYQVQHISSGKYIPPSCATMVTYSQCIGKDELCKRINHPLSYYRLKSEKKGKGENCSDHNIYRL